MHYIDSKQEITFQQIDSAAMKIGLYGKAKQNLARKDVADPKLAFIVGNLAEFYGTGSEHNKPERVKRIKHVSQVLRNLPNKVKFTGFVESRGCTSMDHYNVHFDRESY